MVGLGALCTAVVAICFVGLQMYAGYQSRDREIFQVESGDRIFKFWIDLKSWDQGDPSLLLEVVTRGGEVVKQKNTLGTAFGWSETQTIGLNVVRYEELATVVLGEKVALPLLIWDEQTGRFAPDRGWSEAASAWQIEAERRIEALIGEAVCLGYLSRGRVECRHSSARLLRKELHLGQEIYVRNSGRTYVLRPTALDSLELTWPEGRESCAIDPMIQKAWAEIVDSASAGVLQVREEQIDAPDLEVYETSIALIERQADGQFAILYVTQEQEIIRAVGALDRIFEACDFGFAEPVL